MNLSRKKGCLLALIGVPLLALFLYRLNFGSYTWQQKLTLTVETPSGPMSGSSVVTVAWNDVNSVGNFPASYKGEASVVKLDEGRYLFALIGENTKFLAFRNFRPDGTVGRELFAEMEKLRSAAPVPSKNYPLLVTFDDINDPASVKRVDPDDLAATFGPGYALKSITLEITDEPVTKGKVEDVLGWWCEYRKKKARLNGSASIAVSTNELSDTLGTGSFRIGDCS